MAIRNKRDLRSFFETGDIPTEKNFSDLIESMVNKRDDQFFGYWKPGVTYRNGDVVIYDRTLWILSLPSDTSEICSHVQPSQDERWISLIVPVEDNDWQIIEGTGIMYALTHKKVGIGSNNPQGKLDITQQDKNRFLFNPEGLPHPMLQTSKYDLEEGEKYLLHWLDNKTVKWLSNTPEGFIWMHGPDTTSDKQPDINAGFPLMVIRPESERSKVGIGIASPKAMLDISDGERGQFLLNPDDKTDPALSIINLKPDDQQNYLTSGVGSGQAVFVSDAPNGFSFRKGQEYGQHCNEVNINQGDNLMLIKQHTASGLANVGIDIDDPQAMLEVGKNKQALVRLLHNQTEKPGLILHDLKAGNAKIYNIYGTDQQKRAVWVSNASEGFAIKKGNEFGDNNNENNPDQGTDLFTIKPDGKVGIGTENPYVKTEITNNSNGRFLFNLDRKTNPALGIVNMKPSAKKNYLTIGADNDCAVFVSDSPHGFVFRKGGEAGRDDHEIDINQGQTMVAIKPEDKGKMGIGMLPADYELDLFGQMRAFSMYLNTDVYNLKKDNNLQDDIMNKIMNLRPISFEWEKHTGLEDEGKQYGFRAHEVDDIFPEVVKTIDSGQDIKAVAYQNLVPILVKGMQEQQNTINQQKEELENKDETINNLKERLDNLENRIAQLEGNR